MDSSWLDRVEKRVGFLAAPGLPLFLVAMTVAVGIMREIKPEFVELLALDPAGLIRGEIWRAFTFLLIPPLAGPLLLVLWIALQYRVLQSLETAWGEFRLTFFIAIGAALTALGALGAGAEFGNSELVLASFLAFARLAPDQEVFVMFVLPVKLRWLASLVALWTGVQFIMGANVERIQILTGLAPYALFFGPGHARDLHFAWRRWRNGLP